jgi:uncharacterized membrane protein YdjX (TVP38/TMEM64 family)
MPEKKLLTYGRRILVLLFWAFLIGSYEWYTFQHDLSHIQTLNHMLRWIQSSYGLLALFLLFALRFLVLFPISLLVVIVGASFGLVPGILLALGGVTLSGSTTYWLACWLGEDVVTRFETRSGKSRRWIHRLRTHGFETVLVLHVLFLPFDLISALAGCLHVRYVVFVLATLLGWIPGSIVFTLIGRTLGQRVTDEAVLAPVEPWMFLLIAVVLAGGLIGAQLYRRIMG